MRLSQAKDKMLLNRSTQRAAERHALGVVVLWILALLIVALSALAQEPAGRRIAADVEERERIVQQGRERALDAVMADERFARLHERYPDISRQISFSSQYGCWIVEFLLHGRRIAFCTVVADGGRVLEFSVEKENVEPDKKLQQREREKERKQPVEEDKVDLEALERKERERGGRGLSFLRRLNPHFEGAALFWMALLVTALAAADFKRPFSLRNLDVLSLVAIAPFLIGLWDDQRLSFTATYSITSYLFGRMIFEVFRKRYPGRAANMSSGAFVFLLVLAFTYHLLFIRSHGVDDAGVWSTFGAQHVIRHGTLPYGHFSESHGDSYGPVLYLIQIPFVAAIPPTYSRDGETFPLRPNAFDEGVPYENMHFTAAKVSAMLFDALALLGLILIGWRMGNVSVGLAAAVVYAFSPYVIGMGTGGLSWISHVFPTAVTIFALFWIRRPIVSGLLLAAGAWSLYYPAFLLPLWMGFHWGRWRQMAWFVGTVGFFSLLMVGLLIWPMDAGAERLGAIPKIRLFLNSSVSYQSWPSRFGFWAQYPALQFLEPAVRMAYVGFCLAVFVLPRRKRVCDLVALSAAVIIGTQLWRPHAGGLYITWYMPFLILAYFSGSELEALANDSLEDSARVKAGMVGPPGLDGPSV